MIPDSQNDRIPVNLISIPKDPVLIFDGKLPFPQIQLFLNRFRIITDITVQLALAIGVIILIRMSK